MTTDTKRPPAAVAADRFSLARCLRRFIANNWKAVLYALLILLCVLLAPEEPLKFIYTEF